MDRLIQMVVHHEIQHISMKTCINMFFLIFVICCSHVQVRDSLQLEEENTPVRPECVETVEINT